MSLVDRLLGWDSDGESRPPRPDDETRQRTYEFDLYEVTVAYRNGDTETFEAYGRYSTDSNHITYNVEPTGRSNYHDKGDAHYSFERRTINYRVLDREPESEVVGTETWELSWTVTYEEETHFTGEFARWCPEATDVSIELENRSVAPATEGGDGE